MTLKILIGALLTGLAATAFALPSFEAFKSGHVPSDAQLLSREGVVLSSVRMNHQVRRAAWVPLAQISPAVAQAVLVAEDKNFHLHNGVDWQAAAAALWQNASGQPTRGASSISMQLAGLLDHEAAYSGRRNLLDKATQTAQALRLEQSWSKAQILEAYLNRVDFRGELRGIGAASQVLFAKAPSGLDKQEAATLAALLRSPNAHAATVAQRACGVLRATRPGQACDAKAIAQSLQFRPVAQASPYGAMHAAKAADLKAQGKDKRSSLDARIQAATQAALREQLLGLSQHGLPDGAAVVLHNATGQVLAYAGSSGTLSSAEHVDAASARRQAGSTLKPFLYALLMERQIITAATVLDDAPLTVTTQAGRYTPRNYNERHLGSVSVRKALASSLNTPAVRAVQLAGVDAFHAHLQAHGLSLPQDADTYGEAIALGAADVKLIELANAYRTFANGGLYSRYAFQPGALAPSQRIYSPQTAYVVGNILADNAARASTFGFDSVLATPFWTAVKTGTSKDMRDNWAVGYSAEYTVGVWVGHANGKPMANVSGVSGAAPAWAQIMRALHGPAQIGSLLPPSRAPQPPPGVVAVPVRFFDAVERQFEPSRNEWFAANQAPVERDASGLHTVRLAAEPASPRITEPSDGSQIAWDPDAPPSVAKIALRHSGHVGLNAHTHAARWQLNGKPLTHNSIALATLANGHHKLALLNPAGKVLDEVRFELRGKPVNVR